MTASMRLRRKGATRPVAAALAAVLLGLSGAVGFHRGDHDDLGWLPSRFHHHDFELRGEADEAPLPLGDHCLACHVSRTLVRFAPLPPAPPEMPVAAVATARGSSGAPPARGVFPRTPRAPPAS